MPRAARPWFRFYTETFGDRKIRRLTPAQRWVWAAILGAARESPTPGDLLIAENLPMTRQELADYADVKLREVDATLLAAGRMSMVTDDDGLIRVTNWSARQFESDDVTKRTQNHRERSKERSNDVPKNVRRNTPETETEAETEKPTSRARKRAAQIPTDWKPSEPDVAWQRGEGISDLVARQQLPIFVDHWTSKAEPRADWSATWRNWLRRAPQFTRPAAGSTANGDRPIDPATGRPRARTDF